MSEPSVVVDGVSKKFRLYEDRNQSLKATLLNGGRAVYEDFWALRDVSFDVAEGETFGLIGTNGSGKSTMLKCLAQILRPDEGSVNVRGRVSALLELGAGFHPELSGRENVYLNASILGMAKREVDERFDEIVEFAGLARFIDTPVKNYSSGMYVRLGFAVAVQAEPEVLLIDEVLAVGDESFQRKCNERLAELRRSGTTIVVVSHALGSIRNFCDRVAWLDKGVLREVGPAPRVLNDYLEMFSVEREGPPTDATRWGSGGGRVGDVDLVVGGERVTHFRTGDDVTIRIEFEVDQPRRSPMVHVRIQTLDGTVVTNPNSKEAGVDFGVVERHAALEVTIPDNRLLPGTYDLTILLTDQAGLHVFDAQERLLRFDVQGAEDTETTGGVMTLRARWEQRSVIER